MHLDSRDIEIVRALQADCRMSNADLAAKVGMSSSACWRKTRALEVAGVIAGYRADISAEAAGLTFHALVHVQLSRHNPEHLRQFIDSISTRPEVLEGYATTGQADYHLRVICRDIGAYNAFLEDFLFCLPAVQSAQTNVILREVKRSNAMPL